MSRWWLRSLVLGAVLLHVVPACVDDSLNPQPLPPQKESHAPEGNEDLAAGEPPRTDDTAADAGTDGDASDGGDQ